LTTPTPFKVLHSLHDWNKIAAAKSKKTKTPLEKERGTTDKTYAGMGLLDMRVWGGLPTKGEEIWFHRYKPWYHSK
jgi:hypothetical protein